MKPLVLLGFALGLTGCFPKPRPPETATRVYHFAADNGAAHVLSDFRTSRGYYRLTLISCREQTAGQPPWCSHHVIRESAGADETPPPAPRPTPRSEPAPEFWEE